MTRVRVSATTIPLRARISAFTVARLHSKAASRLRQSILKRAFEGRLVPQDPNDEPAEKLLERIKAEREQLAAAKADGAKSKTKKRTQAAPKRQAGLRKE